MVDLVEAARGLAQRDRLPTCPDSRSGWRRTQAAEGRASQRQGRDAHRGPRISAGTSVLLARVEHPLKERRARRVLRLVLGWGGQGSASQWLSFGMEPMEDELVGEFERDPRRRPVSWALRSRLEPVTRVAHMVRDHLDGIASAIVKGPANAAAESGNARIQRVKRMACGFRNRERFRNAIDFHLGGLDLSPVTHTRS